MDRYERYVRTLLVLAAVAMGLACFGVIASGVRGPLHLAAVFAALWLVCIWYSGRSAPQPSAARGQTPKLAHGVPVVLWAAAMGLHVLAIPQPFLSDDFHLVYGNPYDVSMFWTAGGDGFYRPVGQFLMWVSRQAIPPEPWAWGVWGFALNLATAAAVGLLAWTLDGKEDSPTAPDRRLSMALWASALFLAHGAHPEAAIWVAGRFDVLAALFVIAGLLLSLRWAHGAGAGALAGSLGMMLLAISTKEIAYGYPLLLLLCWWYAGLAPRRMAKGFALHAAAAAAMLLFRFWMFQGVGGYASSTTGSAEILEVTPLHIVKVVFTRLYAILLFPVNWSVWPEPVTASAIALGVLALAYAAWRAPGCRRLAALGTLWALAAAAPGIAQLLIGPDLAKSRLLYLPSVGFCILLGGVFAALPRASATRLAQVALVLSAVAILHHNLSIWREVGDVVSLTCQQAAAIAASDPRPLRFEGLPPAIHGVYAFANGFPVCVAKASGRSPEEFDNAEDSVVEEPVVAPAVVQWNPATRRLPPQADLRDPEPGSRDPSSITP